MEERSGNTGQEKWALVLGATSGAGLAIAKALPGEPGLNIIGVHRGHYPENVKEAEKVIQSLGKKSLFLKMDAGTEESAVSGVSQILSHTGQGAIRVLIHSTSSASVGPLVCPGDEGDRLKVLRGDQIEKTFSTMAHSFVYWTRELFRQGAFCTGARVVALTNYVAPFSLAGMAAIAASKAALEAYVRYLGRELGTAGIIVFGIRFGAVATPSLQYIFGDDWIGFNERARWLSNLRENMKAEDVARILPLFLREEAKWVAGSILPFDAGEAASALGFVARPPRT